MNFDLFSSPSADDSAIIEIAPQAWHLAGLALADGKLIHRLLYKILSQAPLRNMLTPSGKPMSVAMTSCGEFGWVSDHLGYRYQAVGPITKKPWPAMPAEFKQLAQRAAAAVGFSNFQPDSCLINCYQPGSRLSLHQDKDEKDFTQPIVSVSLGLAAEFLFAGLSRTSKKVKLHLEHGDVLVWGGESRLAYHGVLPLADGHHELFKSCRVNLTFRKTGL
jgi:alkylated DNA repair protein (DNA oxidative demethylase)